MTTTAATPTMQARPPETTENFGLASPATAPASMSPSRGPLDDDNIATAEDVVDALDQASTAKDVKAIVLRIDSPGGTYPAADAIADAVGRARSAGKPVIVSMGDVAASGGYLAALRANVIVAQPTTITASIGVFGVWPVATGLLASLGVNVERLSVGTNAGMYSVFQPPTAPQRAAISRQLDEIYAEFTRQVSEARKLEGSRLDAAARGRVFSGIDAQKAGLIDELHLPIVPLLLGGGERLFDDLGDLGGRYEVAEVVSSPAVAHFRLVKAR